MLDSNQGLIDQSSVFEPERVPDLSWGDPAERLVRDQAIDGKCEIRMFPNTDSGNSSPLCKRRQYRSFREEKTRGGVTTTLIQVVRIITQEEEKYLPKSSFLWMRECERILTQGQNSVTEVWRGVVAMLTSLISLEEGVLRVKRGLARSEVAENKIGKALTSSRRYSPTSLPSTIEEWVSTSSKEVESFKGDVNSRLVENDDSGGIRFPRIDRTSCRDSKALSRPPPVHQLPCEKENAEGDRLTRGISFIE